MDFLMTNNRQKTYDLATLVSKNMTFALCVVLEQSREVPHFGRIRVLEKNPNQ